MLLYYKCNTMEHTALLQADYLDILFDHRNKNYGGYELRKHYSERAYKATMITLSAIVILVAANAIASRFKPHTASVIPLQVTTTLVDLKVDQPKPKIELPHTAPPPAAPTKTFTPPVIVHNNDIITPPATVDDLKKNMPGTTDTKGDPNGIDPGIRPVTTTGTGTGIITPPAENKPVNYVEQMPQFDGDLNGYLSSHIRYPQLARENNIEGRVIIKFIVNEDGSATAAEIIKGIGAGCDEEALRVLRTMPKWRPGKQNGHPVKVYFTLPIVFKLG